MRRDNANRTVYVLGLDYQIRSRISWQDAVVGILKGTMSPFKVHETDRIRSAGGAVDMAFPLMVRLNYWTEVPRHEPVDLNTRATRYQILRRDGRTCCYCGEYADTVDHVKPESWCRRDGDAHAGWTWGNLVAACRECNGQKRDRTPEQAGMKMLWSPHLRGAAEYASVQDEVWRILQEESGAQLD